MILTEDGYRPIEDIKVGDKVLTHKGRWKLVNAVMKKKDAPLRKIKADGVPGLVTTDEHPFYAVRQESKHSTLLKRQERIFSEPEWVQAKDLTKSHRLSQVLPEIAINDKPADFWWLIGRYLAGGWRVDRKDRSTDSGRVVICCAKSETAELAPRIEKVYHATQVEERTTYKFHIGRNELYHFLEDFGNGASNKRLPGYVYSLNPELARALMDGYFSGDGGVQIHPTNGNQELRATSTSKSLALGMALLAQRAYGVVAGVRYYKTKDTTVIEDRVVNQKDFWIVSIPTQNRSAFIEGNYGWKLVKENEPCGKGTVYNIAVMDDESYVAEGAVVHNCQPFSISGVSKKNALGRAHGFQDKTQGTLFFDVARIIAAKRPQAFILENVKNLISHDKGRTFAVILDTLEELGYHVKYQVLNASHLVPQNRERIFLVGFKSKAKAGQFQFPDLAEIYRNLPGARKSGPNMHDILETKVDPKFQLSDKTLELFTGL